MAEWLRSWRFDPGTSILTVFLSPIALYLLNILRKQLKEWGRFVLDAALFRCGRFLHTQIASHIALKRYARLRLSDDSRYLHVPSSRDIKLSVDEAFVPLSLEHFGSTDKIYDHSSVMTLGNRIRVIGDPGSGKSSLVKRLFRDSCYLAISKAKVAQLPILVELRSLEVPPKKADKELGSWLLERIRTDVAKNSAYQMLDCFDTYLRDRGLFILLDGLDEVSTKNYSRVRSAINGLSEMLARNSENNAIVLTMRTQFHQQIKDDYRNSFGRAVFLKPFSPSDIYEFLSRWPFESHREKTITRIYSELTDRPSLREMCGNPLVLSMYVAEDQAHGQVIAPESRTEFYKKVTEELIIKRRLQQTGVTPAHAKLREQREEILGKMAFEHMLNVNEPANSLSWSNAIRITRETLNCSISDAEENLLHIASETGLVSEERPKESLRFIHLTFCEFLAAFEATQGQSEGWSKLIEKHKEIKSKGQHDQYTRLVEVIPFGCGLSPRISRANCISDVLDLGDNAMLARCFLETKLYEHCAWQEFVESEKLSLLSAPDAEWNSEWLRRLHLFNVVSRDAQECAKHSPSIGTLIDLDAFFGKLVEKRQGNLANLLSAYAAQDAAAVFRLSELSHLDLVRDFPDVIVKNCDQTPFYALVLEQAKREHDRIRVWAAIFSEAAFRSSIVLLTMKYSPRLEEWEGEYNKLPKSDRWDRYNILPKCFLTQCISLGLSQHEILGESSVLRAIVRLPPPSSYKYSSFVSLLFLPMTTLSLIGWTAFGLASLFFPELRSSFASFSGFSEKDPMIFLCLFLLLFGIYMAFLQNLVIKRLYSRVLCRPIVVSENKIDSVATIGAPLGRLVFLAKYMSQILFLNITSPELILNLLLSKSTAKTLKEILEVRKGAARGMQ